MIVAVWKTRGSTSAETRAEAGDTRANVVVGEGVEAFLGGFVGGLEVLGDLVDSLADSRVARTHGEQLDRVPEGMQRELDAVCRRVMVMAHWGEARDQAGKKGQAREGWRPHATADMRQKEQKGRSMQILLIVSRRLQAQQGCSSRSVWSSGFGTSREAVEATKKTMEGPNRKSRMTMDYVRFLQDQIASLQNEASDAMSCIHAVS